MKYFKEYNLETGMSYEEGDEVDDCYIYWLEEKVSQNLPKANAYSLLAEVRVELDKTFLQAVNNGDDEVAIMIDNILKKLADRCRLPKKGL